MLAGVTTHGVGRRIGARAGRLLRPRARAGRLLRPRGRGRLPTALVAVASLVAVTAAVSSAATAPPGARFAQAGHWFANPAEDVVYHVNGSARSVDAQARIDGIGPGSQVVQGDTTGYVISSDRIVEFGKATLSVERTLTPPAAEMPVAVEANGGPYLVYRETGTVVRLGVTPATVRAGGKLGDPVATPDGTLWLQRTGNVLCRLRPGTVRLSCPASAPEQHTGALSVVGDSPVFVDTSADTLSPVTADGLGRATPLGVDLPADARIAGADVQGRLAVLDPAGRRLHLVDAGGPGSGRPATAPVTVDLPEGAYSAPSAGRSSVVLLDTGRRQVLTYDRDGRRQAVTAVPAESGEPRLARGEDDRVYVEGGEGRNVLVVDDRGRAAAVPLPGATRPAQPPSSAPPSVPSSAPSPTTTVPPPPADTSGDPEPGSGTEAPPRSTPPVEPPASRRAAVPASPPGMPPGLTANPRGGDLAVGWGAAAANGAPVTGYHVTWAPAAGGNGRTITAAGGSRSATLTGITPGVAYRITVAAQNSAGRGPAATARATVAAPARTLTVSRGDTTSYDHGCEPPECAFIRVELRGFEPNSAYEIEPYSSEWGHFNPGARLTTDAEGNLTARRRFPFNGVGQRVWVVVDGMHSNHLLWTAG